MGRWERSHFVTARFPDPARPGPRLGREATTPGKQWPRPPRTPLLRGNSGHWTPGGHYFGEVVATGRPPAASVRSGGAAALSRAPGRRPSRRTAARATPASPCGRGGSGSARAASMSAYPSGTADVLRRAGALTLDADRVDHLGLGRRDVLDQDLVLPPVAEVVRVAKPRPLAPPPRPGASRVRRAPRADRRGRVPRTEVPRCRRRAGGSRSSRSRTARRGAAGPACSRRAPAIRRQTDGSTSSNVIRSWKIIRGIVSSLLTVAVSWRTLKP